MSYYLRLLLLGKGTIWDHLRILGMVRDGGDLRVDSWREEFGQSCIMSLAMYL